MVISSWIVILVSVALLSIVGVTWARRKKKKDTGLAADVEEAHSGEAHSGEAHSESRENDPVSEARASVERNGWHVVGVRGDSGGPAFLFTIGLWQSYRHPEVIQILPSENLEGMAGGIQRIGEAIAAGEVFEPNKIYPGLFNDYPGAFRPMEVCWYPFYLGTAMAVYKWQEFPTLQAYWPDSQGRFPWQEGVEEGTLRAQARLDEVVVEKANLPPGVATGFVGLEGFDASPENLFIEPNFPLDANLLADWRWLVAEDLEPIGVTEMGDVFLRNASGAIYWLDTSRPELEKVASSEERWREMLPSHAPRWLHAEVFEVVHGVEIPAGHVFSWRQSSLLGGEKSPNNLGIVSAEVHLSNLGRFVQGMLRAQGSQAKG